MSKAEKIVRLLETKGTRRVFELTEGSVETRDGGSVSWRNNNPGNLKLEYAGSADKTVTTPRSYDAALKSARDRFDGVVALDQWGNAVFESPEAGRAAHATLLSGRHGDRTIPEMLGRYARDDYTGKADTEAYAKSVYAVGDRQGVDLRDKKIKDLSAKEFGALLDGMKKVEGFQEGTVTRTPAKTTGSLDAPADPSKAQPALSLAQQRVHQMAVERLSTTPGAHYSPEQIDTIARQAAQLATTHAGRGEVQGLFLSKDQQTIALKHEFGLSEVGVKDALCRSQDASMVQQNSTHEAIRSGNTQPQALQMAALSR
jgi:hypothetical protein